MLNQLYVRICSFGRPEFRDDECKVCEHLCNKLRYNKKDLFE